MKIAVKVKSACTFNVLLQFICWPNYDKRWF